MPVFFRGTREELQVFRRLAATASRKTLVLCAALTLPIILGATAAAVIISPYAKDLGREMWNCEYSASPSSCERWSTISGYGYGVLVPIVLLLFGAIVTFLVAYALATSRYRPLYRTDYVTVNRIRSLRDRGIILMLPAAIGMTIILAAAWCAAMQ